jgi:aldose 1-epimerase
MGWYGGFDTSAAVYPERVPEPTASPRSSDRPAPSGAQYRIGHGNQRATVVEVGAAVREYRDGDREVFQSYPEHHVSWAYHGTVLLPWPNRLRDGRYEFDGEDLQVALTEPSNHNALHGLAAWLPWSLLAHEPSSVTLECRILPTPGYPFHLDTVVNYELLDAGLVVTTTSTNNGDRACPYALGFHPYVSTGPDATLDDCTLHIDAARRLLVDDRLIPEGESEPVAGTADDFRGDRPLAGRVLDTGFTDVAADSQGSSWVRVASSDGHTVQVWADANFGFWQVYSGDALPAPLARRSLAVEPMTAAPNAFQTGDGLRRLEPGESVTSRWGARLAITAELR